MSGQKSINMQSIVVLPFENTSNEADHEFLCDGISEELMAILSSNPALRVISRKSAFTFKNQSMSSKELREQLDVDFIVEGKLRLAANKIRVSVELIDAESDAQIWSRKWDRSVDAIFDLEDELSLLISDQIREHVGHFDIKDQPIHRQKVDFDIYQKLLEAKFLFYKWNPTDTEKAIHLFQSVLDQEPDNMDALIGLSDAYSFMAMTNFMNPMEAWEISKSYTDKAFAIDSDHAGVYYLKSNSAFFTKGNYQDALAYALKAVELRPNYSEALQFVAFFYTIAKKFDLAETYFDRALAVDPLNQETIFFKAYYDYRLGDYEKAIQQFDALMQTNPYNLPAIVTKSYVMIKAGRYEENIDYLNSFSTDILMPDEKLGAMCVTYIAAGNKDKADEALTQLQVIAKDPYAFQAKSYLFWSYALLGKVDEALQLAKSIKEMHISIILISFADPIVECLYSHPEYQELFEEMYLIDSISEPEIKKEKPVLIEDEDLKEHFDQLLSYMEEEEPYLNPKLSLRSLAQEMQIHPNQLSYVLNTSSKKNFNSFVNDYRIDYFKKIAVDSSKSHISFLGLAYESGFNSKTVFNTYFKKREGITPGAYMKQQK